MDVTPRCSVRNMPRNPAFRICPPCFRTGPCANYASNSALPRTKSKSIEKSFFFWRNLTFFQLARRDFIVALYDGASIEGRHDILALARDLRVHDAVIRALIIQMMAESPAHPDVIAYLSSRQEYSPALAAQLTERARRLRVGTVAGLRAASASRSKSVRSLFWRHVRNMFHVGFVVARCYGCKI
jgi:hypothetical protein